MMSNSTLPLGFLHSNTELVTCGQFFLIDSIDFMTSTSLVKVIVIRLIRKIVYLCTNKLKERRYDIPTPKAEYPYSHAYQELH